MRLRLATLALSIAAMLAIPAAASAKVPASKLLIIRQGTPLAQVRSLSTVPLGWGSSAEQAIVAAERSPTMLALHRRMHPLRAVPFVWRARHPYWFVAFIYRGKLVADANVTPAGELLGAWTGLEALVPYAHGDLAPVLTGWWIFVPASLLFALVFFDPKRLRRIAHLDCLAVLSFLISYDLLVQGDLEAAVWLMYPPLIYLLVRLLRVGLGRSRPEGRSAPLLSTTTLTFGLPLLLVARIVLSVLGHQEIDVGDQSVMGAFRILHHLPIYYNDPNHGDTYGPITYLAYVPFEALFPLKSVFSGSHTAEDLAAICFDLGTVAGLVWLGCRLRAGAAGRRLGLVLGWGWAACPFTIYGLVVHTNDGLVSMLCVFALIAITYPVVSGALLGLATAAKFSPAGILPLLAAPRQRGLKSALVYVGSFTAVVATTIFSWLPKGGLSYFWQRTIGFQMNRVDVYSPWALHPGLHPVQVLIEVGAVLLAAAVVFVPRERSLMQVCALAGAITIATQLPAKHWYYYYIMWFLPFALVGLLARSEQAVQTVADEIGVPEAALERPQPEPALVGA